MRSTAAARLDRRTLPAAARTDARAARRGDGRRRGSGLRTSRSAVQSRRRAGDAWRDSPECSGAIHRGGCDGRAARRVATGSGRARSRRTRAVAGVGRHRGRGGGGAAGGTRGRRHGGATRRTPSGGRPTKNGTPTPDGGERREGEPLRRRRRVDEVGGLPPPSSPAGARTARRALPAEQNWHSASAVMRAAPCRAMTGVGKARRRNGADAASRPWKAPQFGGTRGRASRRGKRRREGRGWGGGAAAAADGGAEGDLIGVRPRGLVLRTPRLQSALQAPAGRRRSRGTASPLGLGRVRFGGTRLASRRLIAAITQARGPPERSRVAHALAHAGLIFSPVALAHVCLFSRTHGLGLLEGLERARERARARATRTSSSNMSLAHHGLERVEQHKTSSTPLPAPGRPPSSAYRAASSFARTLSQARSARPRSVFTISTRDSCICRPRCARRRSSAVRRTSESPTRLAAPGRRASAPRATSRRVSAARRVRLGEVRLRLG